MPPPPLTHLQVAEEESGAERSLMHRYNAARQLLEAALGRAPVTDYGAGQEVDVDALAGPLAVLMVWLRCGG